MTTPSFRPMRPLLLALPSGGTVEVSRCFILFQPWLGARISDSYGSKPQIDLGGKAVFAELAILRMPEGEGWDGRWVDTYRGKFRIGWPDESPLPARQKALYDRIVWRNSGRSGCWDVMAWYGDQVPFAESKQQRKD